MKRFAGVVLLVAAGACSSGPPAISEVKMGKDKDVTQAATTFDARDTLFAVANIDNPPANGKVVGRLSVVEVEGQQAGPIPGLETALDLGSNLNTANFNFTAPTAGWPNGKYRFDVVLLDEAGAEKGQKSAEFTTSGNTPPAEVATEPAAVEGEEAPAEEDAAPQQ
ncbi:MAG TPA: hypothetical protein VF618_22215 [Thermoanaerobaculia bacterium]